MPNTDPKLFSRTTALKSTYPGLEVWISVGGWTFNDVSFQVGALMERNPVGVRSENELSLTTS